MNDTKRDHRLLKLHKRWADRMTIISQAVIVGTFILLYVVLSYSHVSPEDRALSLLLLVAVELAGIIWQAVAFGVYKVHELVETAQPAGGRL